MKELLMSEERCMQLMELIQPFEEIMAGAPAESTPYDLWVHLQHAFYQKLEGVSPIEMRALFSMAIARHAVESMIAVSHEVEAAKGGDR